VRLLLKIEGITRHTEHVFMMDRIGHGLFMANRAILVRADGIREAHILPRLDVVPIEREGIIRRVEGMGGAVASFAAEAGVVGADAVERTETWCPLVEAGEILRRLKAAVAV